MKKPGKLAALTLAGIAVLSSLGCGAKHGAAISRTTHTDIRFGGAASMYYPKEGANGTRANDSWPTAGDAQPYNNKTNSFQQAYNNRRR
ncbi:MAG: hypothetical protein ACP5D2_01525 [Candidatus Nanoarchaeia archaeon]